MTSPPEGRGASAAGDARFAGDPTLAEALLGRFELLGLTSAVWAALDADVLRALVGERPRTVAELAGELDLRPDLLERTLGLVATTDLLREVEGEDDVPRYAAGGPLEALQRHGSFFADMELSAWSRLPELLHAGCTETGVPAGHRGPIYAEIAEDLVRIEEPAARRLAGELELAGGRVLDVGCGAGVWSLALAEANPGLRVTGLDLPGVAPRFLERARTLGLADRAEVLAGDMESVEVEAEGFDLVIVANVLRLVSTSRARRLVERFGGAVAPSGAFLVIDAFPGSSARSRRLHAAYRLHLRLRNRRGDTHEPDRVAGWLEEDGFARVEPLELGTEGPMRGLLGRR